jgi:hypothetical protein
MISQPVKSVEISKSKQNTLLSAGYKSRKERIFYVIDCLSCGLFSLVSAAGFSRAHQEPYKPAFSAALLT